MKQHITPKQLNELSEKGKKRLRKWWWGSVKHRAYPDDTFYCDKEKEVIYESLPNKECDLPLLSIGQMIEFLDEWGLCISHEKHQDHQWFVSSPRFYEVKKSRLMPISFTNKELCDALWEAVKELLNKEA